MKKLALITGINYEGTTDALGGCINDATDILQKLVGDFGFYQSDIQLLIEEVATRKNILDGLEYLVKELEPEDIGVFYYAGHGTQTADLPPIDEDDMLDEAIVPIDALNNSNVIHSNLIRDNEIQEILSKLAKDVHFVVISDSCHSETITRDPIKKRVNIRKAETIQDIKEIFNDLKMTKKEHPELRKRRAVQPTSTTLKIKEIMKNLKGTKRKRDVLEKPKNHILLAGCKDSESSFDDGTNGYFTTALIKYMEKGITYKDLYDLAREDVLNRSYDEQDPQIYGEDRLKTKKIFE